MTKECPYCAEEIKLEAIKCKHCGSSLKGSGINEDIQNIATDKVKVKLRANSLSSLILGIIIFGFGFYECTNGDLGG